MKNVYSKLFEFRKITGKVVKSASNPFFKSKYSDLNSVIDATDPALEQVGLVYIDRVVDLNLIAEIWDFESGECISSTIPLIMTKQDMQQLGGAITYARRYARMALCGLQAVDDDGNHVSGKTAKPTMITTQQVSDIQKLADTVGLTAAQVCTAWKMKSISQLQSENFTKMTDWLNTQKKGA